MSFVKPEALCTHTARWLAILEHLPPLLPSGCQDMHAKAAKQAQLTGLLDEQLNWREEVAAEEAAEARQVGACTLAQVRCVGSAGLHLERALLGGQHRPSTCPISQEDARIRAVWAREDATAAAAAEAERARQQALAAATLEANRRAVWQRLKCSLESKGGHVGAMRHHGSTWSLPPGLPLPSLHLPASPGIPPPCRQRQAELARRAAQEQAADENIVQAGLQAAAAAEAQERAAREARRAAAVAYHEEVVAQMEREQADSAAWDAQLSAAMEAQQAKRDAEQAARDAARRRLMQDVCAIREQQLAAKQAARAAEAEASLRQRLAAEAEARREAEAAEGRRQLERQQQLQQHHNLQARQGHGLGVVHVLFGVARLLTPVHHLQAS